MSWVEFLQKLKSMHASWFTPTGSHMAYRLSQADMLACVKMMRGDTRQIWLESEPRSEQCTRQKDELYLAYEEIRDTLQGWGLTAVVGA